MHIDWNWNKQRPQFIAEGLSDYFDIKVIYMVSKRFLFKNHKSSTNNKLDVVPAFRLPFYENRWIYELNKLYLKTYFNFIIKKFKPDFIWITFPQLFDYIQSGTSCKIIYDCMDLATGFEFSDDFRLKVADQEKKLIKESDFVFASSKKLYSKLIEEYQCGNKLFLIRNAFGGQIISDKNIPKQNDKEPIYKIGYVGSINESFDFKKILLTLDHKENIEYHLIGPLDQVEEINNERIKFHGFIEYDKLYENVKNFDALIVPFKITERILAADPGKIYGYINYNKPIISVYYEELSYFSEFIYFYSSGEDLLKLLNDLSEGGFVRKYSNEERINFLKNNSWDVRVNEIREYLNKIS